MNLLKSLILVLLGQSLREPKSVPAPQPIEERQPKVNNDENRIITVIIFTLGSLEVYALQTLKETDDRVVPRELYWRDDGSPQGHGPFLSLHQTMEHYKHTIEEFKRRPVVPEPLEERTAAILNVDFRNSRKRLHDV